MISCVFINIWGLIFSQVCHAKMWYQDLSHTKLQATEYPWNTSFNLCLQKYTSKVSYVYYYVSCSWSKIKLEYKKNSQCLVFCSKILQVMTAKVCYRFYQNFECET